MYIYKLNENIANDDMSNVDDPPVKSLPTIKPILTVANNTNGFARIMSINLEYVNKLNKCKDRISKYNSIEWEDLKKLSNPYEYIYIFNSKTQYNGVAKVKPLSRSFFKMIEIGNRFLPWIKKQKSIRTLHLAEGPGGFIEAVNHLRGDLRQNDVYFGITLIDKNKSVPCWNQSKQFLTNNPHIKILVGADGTGNIYNPANIINIIGNIGDGACDLITGDGGFDFSVDYNYQEQASSKLIFAQIIAGLKCLKVSNDSVFVCKFFDMSNYLTVELLYLLTVFFKETCIYKPVTSRIANSEKYIICCGYLGCNEQYWGELLNLLVLWNKIEKELDDKKNRNTINYIFESIPSDFVMNIKKINMEIIDGQIASINNTIEISKKGLDKNNEWIEKNRKIQIQNAREWCSQNGIAF